MRDLWKEQPDFWFTHAVRTAHLIGGIDACVRAAGTGALSDAWAMDQIRQLLDDHRDNDTAGTASLEVDR